MPFCPKCRNEFVADTHTCEDCGVALVDELTKPAAGPPEQTELVEVWHTQGEIDAQLVRSLLESNGIDSMFSGEALRLTHGFTLDGLAEVRILVRSADAKRACDIIAALEDMKQCPQCDHPAHNMDRVCHYCDHAFD